jgi:nicotinate-nucleotide adenylyltransferase
MRYGILGGSYDPPHIGHLVLAQEAVWQLKLDRLLLIPSADPPHKGAPAVAAEHRLAMLRLAVRGDPRLVVSDLEVRRPGKSYTILTVESLIEEHGGAAPYVIVGADNVADLPGWRDVHRLLDLCTMVVATRPGTDASGLARSLARLGPEHAARLEKNRIEIPALDVSSHEIRLRASEGKPIRHMVPDAVVDYINERELYRPS